MLGRIFRKKLANTTVVLWGTRGNQVLDKKIRMTIHEIKPFKKTFLGVQNHPSSLGFVADAMEVKGEALEDIEKNNIFFLVPEFEIESFQPQEEVELWISDKGYCYKIEKISSES